MGENNQVMSPYPARQVHSLWSILPAISFRCSMSPAQSYPAPKQLLWLWKNCLPHYLHSLIPHMTSPLTCFFTFSLLFSKSSLVLHCQMYKVGITAFSFTFPDSELWGCWGCHHTPECDAHQRQVQISACQWALAAHHLHQAVFYICFVTGMRCPA